MGQVNLKPLIEAEIAKARKLKPGYTGSDLSGIINSYGDTMDDAWVLEQLKKWNARQSSPLVSI